MKPKNAVAWRLRTTAEGYYEDGWLYWNVNWSAHDEAVRNGCSIEYAVPEPPRTPEAPTQVMVTVPGAPTKLQVPSFEEWHQRVHGLSFRQRCCNPGTPFQESIIEMLQATADYATFAMRFAAESK